MSIRQQRRGIAMPVIFGLALCMAVWVASLSWTMSNSRHRFQKVIKMRRAYFMARSALQHFFLKIKIMQRRHPQVMMALEKAEADRWRLLSQAFVEDIVLPVPEPDTVSAHYGIASFSIGTIDVERALFTMEIAAMGRIDEVGETIRRVQRLSR